MKKNKNLKIILYVVLGLVIFWILGFTVAYTGYRMVRYNPVDTVAIPYLRENLDTEEYAAKYGDIKRMNRLIIPLKKETDTTVCAPYAVTTEQYELRYLVTLVKQNGEWIGQSYELYEAYKIVTEERFGNKEEYTEPISLDELSE